MHIYTPPEQQPDILHLDEHFLVVEKPAGLLSVPGRAATHKDCLISRVQTHYPEALIVHRLDMETSGLMILARDVDSHRKLSKSFELRDVYKEYQADITGAPDQDFGIINLPMRCDIENRPRQIVDHIHGKNAETQWNVTKRYQSYSRVLLKPITGRSHQLRVHMQSLGHPILGDSLYANDEGKRIALLRAEVKTGSHVNARMHLHASHIRFPHPTNGAEMSFDSPCPF